MLLLFRMIWKWRCFIAFIAFRPHIRIRQWEGQIKSCGIWCKRITLCLWFWWYIVGRKCK